MRPRPRGLTTNVLMKKGIGRSSSMIRNFFSKSIAQPELFGNPRRAFPWREAAILLLILLLPVAFYVGYRSGRGNCAEEPAPPEETSGAVPAFPSEFVGRYALDVGGHRGYLIVYASPNGAPAATLQFTNWGKRVPEPLWSVYVSGRAITFTRACAGARCAEIGASAPFRQTYTGEMLPGDREIRGTYSGGQSASSWKAVRF
jgi:hypothetical protein